MRNGLKQMVVCLLAAVAVMTGCAQKKETGRAVIDQVRINEVMSANSYYLPLPDKSCYDWIEFTNTSDEAVNLKGCYLSDNGKMPRKWEIPTDLAIEPGGYGIVYLSGLNMTDEYGNIHANFKLSSKGETLVFSNAAGDVIQQISIPESGVSNISYGYDSAAEDYAWFAEPSPGRENSGATSRTPETLVFPPSGVVINEYMTKNTYVIYDSNNCYCDWVELYNTTDSDVSLNGYSLSDRQEGGRWFFPEDAVIGAGGYLLVFCSDQTSAVPGEYHTGFGLSAGETLSLYSIAGQQVDSVTLGDLNPNVSCGRDPESGEFRLFASPTPGGANTSYSFALTAAVSAAPYSPVFVSEALCVSDKDGDFKNDFIEIHNTSANAVSLSGYGLSKSAEGAAFVFPDVTLAPGGYAVVYCSGKNVSKKGKTMQAAFKLNQGGEDIWLFDDGGHIIDIFPSGKQTAGHSSGRVDSRKNEVVVFETPTPGQSNGGITTYAGYAPSPVFSSGGGYVPSGFQFTVAAPEDCTVYYTTDGQMPTSASHKYKGPITVVKSTVVRAVAYRAGYLPSQMTTATFLVEKEHTVPVVSVISDPAGLFSRATGIMSSEKGGLVPGGSNYYSTEEREITFEYYVGGKRAVSFEAMTRMFGETSRKEKQKSIAVLLSEKCGANYKRIKCGAVQAYSNLYITAKNIGGFVNEPPIAGINTKNQDYTIYREMKVTVTSDSGSSTQPIQVPILAIENKTYLDKTMLEGAIATAEKLKSGNPYSTYIVVTETYAVACDVDPAYSRIDQIFVLRKCKHDKNNRRPQPISPDVLGRLVKMVEARLTDTWADVEERMQNNGEIINQLGA